MYAKTAFILNYDEGGQFFDHHWNPTPPMSADDGASTVTTDGERNHDMSLLAPMPIGLGFRVCS
jgi:phospholipase C